MALRFAEAETTHAYMRTLRGYLDEHGRPVALYSDKHSIFRGNQQDREGEPTQFTRALKTLDIQPIQANTPQAFAQGQTPIPVDDEKLWVDIPTENCSLLPSLNPPAPDSAKPRALGVHRRRRITSTCGAFPALTTTCRDVSPSPSCQKRAS